MALPKGDQLGMLGGILLGGKERYISKGIVAASRAVSSGKRSGSFRTENRACPKRKGGRRGMWRYVLVK